MGKLTVVTGAAGFIGRNTVAALNQRGNEDLLLVDTLGTDEKWRNLLGLRYEDLISPDQFLALISGRGAVQGIDSIIHLGACSATTERMPISCFAIITSTHERSVNGAWHTMRASSTPPAAPPTVMEARATATMTASRRRSARSTCMAIRSTCLICGR